MFAEILGEFLSCFKAADANLNGVLEMAEFRVYTTKMSECMKARFGEGLELDDKECEQWYNAHNRLTPHKEGVSMEDFMAADEIMKKLA